MAASKVCFTAVAAKGEDYGPFAGDRVLVFEKAITNIGNAYDPTSGLFKVPLAGYYYFSFFYQASKTQKSGLSLAKNNSVIIKTFDDTKPGIQYVDNGGNSTVLKLHVGDTVAVKLPAHCCVHAFDNVTTFSGFLIAEE